MSETILHSERERIRDLFVGRSIKRAEAGALVLDDGRRVYPAGNQGCPGCGNGDYALTRVVGCPNLITEVDVERVDDHDGEEPYETRYRLFVIAEDRRVNVAEFVGDDGNGWYGTGFWLEVRA